MPTKSPKPSKNSAASPVAPKQRVGKNPKDAQAWRVLAAEFRDIPRFGTKFIRLGFEEKDNQWGRDRGFYLLTWDTTPNGGEGDTGPLALMNPVAHSALLILVTRALQLAERPYREAPWQFWGELIVEKVPHHFSDWSDDTHEGEQTGLETRRQNYLLSRCKSTHYEKALDDDYQSIGMEFLHSSIECCLQMEYAALNGTEMPSPKPLMAYGLRHFREKKLKHSQEWLAEQIGKTREWVSNLETLKKPISPKLLDTMCQKFKCSRADILEKPSEG